MITQSESFTKSYEFDKFPYSLKFHSHIVVNFSIKYILTLSWKFPYIGGILSHILYKFKYFWLKRITNQHKNTKSYEFPYPYKIIPILLYHTVKKFPYLYEIELFPYSYEIIPIRYLRKIGISPRFGWSVDIYWTAYIVYNTN